MKIQFGIEWLTLFEQFDRFTFIACQIQRVNDEMVISVWLMGFGLSIVF
jgi:hypothetical protein